MPPRWISRRRDGYASMAKSFMTTALRLRGAQRRCDLSDLRHVYAQVVVLGRDARRKRRRARVNRADSRSSKAVSRPEGSIADLRGALIRFGVSDARAGRTVVHPPR